MNFDAVTSFTGTSSSHTCTGSDLSLFIGVIHIGTISGITYNSVAMTQIATVAVGNNGETVDLWYLANPSTGANTISISGSTSHNSRVVSYTGTSGTQPDAFATKSQNQTGATISQALTVVGSNCWAIAFMRNDGDVSNHVSGPASTRRGSVSSVAFFDSNGTVSGGSNTFEYTPADSGSYDWGLIVASISPMASSSTSTRSSLLLSI